MLKTPTPLTAFTSKNTVADFEAAIKRGFSTAKRHRDAVSSVWDETYELYRSSKADLDASRGKASQATGRAADWHHRVNVGKTFEAVETLVAYFKGATFPSDDWFDLASLEPDRYEEARVVKELAKDILERARVRDVCDDFYRQLILYGIGYVKVGWDTRLTRTFSHTEDFLGTVVTNTEVSTLDLEAVSTLDVWLDTSDRLADCGVYRRLHLTRGQLQYEADTGYYTIDDDAIDGYEPSVDNDPARDKSAQSDRDTYETVEYYGPMLVGGVHYWCVHAVLFNGALVRLADSEYWCGNPYVKCSLLPNRDSIYGMSPLHPLLGQLHVLNVLTNSRLDNIIMHIAKMFTFIEDGILTREDIKIKPGAIFPVAQHGSLQPMDLGNANFTVTYSEEATLHSNIDRATSTGPLVGAGQPRGGERVTAEEIQAVRDSGGNRLSAVHVRIEDQATLPLLAKVFTLIRQHIATPQVVKVLMPDSDVKAFYPVTPDMLQYDYALRPLGATYVVQTQRTLSDILQLLDVTSRAPQMSERLDYGAILTDVLRQMRFPQPSRYIKKEQVQAAPEMQAPATPLDNVTTQAGIQQQLQTDGGQGMMESLGVPTDGVDPAQLQSLLGAAVNDSTTGPSFGNPSSGGGLDFGTTSSGGPV
jgi:hypothetical protein